ncbi:MAG: FAD-dependent oxidoreductase [bacterium]|nr:FAD-dependent oxidoreductase [bacterium]
MNKRKTRIHNNSKSFFSARRIAHGRTHYVIIGNGPAATSAIAAIRETDRDNPITLISDEPYQNYSRPLLSYVLAKKITFDQLPYLPETFYKSHQVKLILNSSVVQVDSKNSQVILSDKTKINYDKLLIATGAKPVIPKIEGTKLQGVFPFTKLQDVEQMTRYIDTYQITEAVVVGGGLIGLKATEGLMGRAIKVTIIELADRILSTTFDKKASQIIKRALENKGCAVITKNSVREIKGEHTRVKSVVLNNGRTIQTGLVILAIGVSPNIELVRRTPIKLNRGIIVDTFMRTSVENVYAAGDCCESIDLLNHVYHPIAIWFNAARQGRVAGANMAGIVKEYPGSIPMNSVELCGIPSISVGITMPKDKTYQVKEYEFPERGIYKKVVLKDNRIVGIIFLGEIERAGIYTGLIKDRADVTEFREYLGREDFGLVSLPKEYRKHLVTGEGLEV